MLVIWLVLGVVLLVVELTHFGFFALFGALGAFAAAVVAVACARRPSRSRSPCAVAVVRHRDRGLPAAT